MSTPERIKIDWLGNVFKPGDRFPCGHLICGPDERGYTISTLTGLEHIPANQIEIRLKSGAPYVAGETVKFGSKDPR